MKRLLIILCLLSITSYVSAESGWSGDSAVDIKTDTIYFDGVLSSLDENVQLALETIDEIAVGGPADATYITQTTSSDLSAEQALTSLTDGIVKVNGTTGVLSTAIADTDYDSSTTNEINTITCPDANVTAGLGITFADTGIMTITESADTITFDATEAQTLDNVADLGATTNQALTVGGLTSSGGINLDNGVGSSPSLSFIDADNNYFALIKYDAGAGGLFNNEGAIRLAPSNDTNDYLEVSTAAGIVTIATIAGDDGDLVLTAGGGDISTASTFEAATLTDGTASLSSGALSGITTLGMNNQLTNTLADGTAPLVITSTTVVDNLNVDQVDGYDLDQSVASGATPTFTGTNITGLPAASVLAGTFGTGAYVFDSTVSGITTLGMGGDLTNYEAVNDANPEIRIGSADANEGHIHAVYDTGAQTLDYLEIKTDSGGEGDIVLSPASGFVGIGTTGPNVPLQIYHATAPIISLTAGGSNPAISGAIDLLERDTDGTGFGTANAYGFRIVNDGSAGVDMLKIKGGEAATVTDLMVIDRISGNVGIGTTSPDEALTIGNGGKLQVNSAGDDKNVQVAHNDTNGTITVSSGYLVLGGISKADTGDPAGVEGIIYYNNTDNVIRMYADGAWRTLASW